jgi:hypothetical protein
MVHGPLVKEVCWDHLLHDLLEDRLAQLVGGDLLRMLSGDDDSVHAEGNRSATVLLVLDGDLRFGIGSQPWEGTRSARSGHRRIKLVRKHDGQRHVFLRFIRSIAKHDTLIASADLLQRVVVQGLSNVGGLLLDGDKDVAGLVVEALGRVVISDLLDCVTNNSLVVNDGLGADLAKDHDHARLRGGLTGDFGKGILSQTSIELQNAFCEIATINR